MTEPEQKPPVTGAKKSKRRKLDFEHVYLERLPCAEMYHKSYMHRVPISHIAVAHRTEFVITASQNGHVKFWKKQPRGIEFVKHFRAHSDIITDLSISWDGLYAATASSDGTVKIFDVPSFDMINVFTFESKPKLVQWIYCNEAEKPEFAVSFQESPTIKTFYLHSDANTASSEFSDIHKSPVVLMKHNRQHDIMVSCDDSAILEYWSPKNGQFPKENVSFEFKMETDLFEFAQKTAPLSIEFSPDGSLFSTWSVDRKVRIFRVQSGKIIRQYDESFKTYNEMQTSGPAKFKLDPIDFGRRMAVERELQKSEGSSPCNIVFDETGNFIMYPSMLGIKLINITTNALIKIIGKVEQTERFTVLSLFQGKAKGIAGSAVGSASAVRADEDPTLFCAAFKKNRFYLFSRQEPDEPDDTNLIQQGRDVFNEKPTREEQAAAIAEPKHARLARNATIHTTEGDIHLTLFPTECPKTVENFTVHAKNGYYDGLIFHRVIRGFMIQTGDPLGDGTGGTSIWRKDFEDEFNRTLRHDRPFCLSMANAGPNTNGSQFFITTVATPWLDNKHTLFGRVVKGSDVVQSIEKMRVDKDDKPLEEIKIVNITISYEKSRN